jgi:hypothetical protein
MKLYPEKSEYSRPAQIRYAQRHPERVRAMSQKWREENKEFVQDYSKKYREKTREKHLAYMKQWHRDHPTGKGLKRELQFGNPTIDYREENRKKLADFWRAHPTAKKDYQREYRAKNKKHNQSLQRKWREENRDKVIAYQTAFRSTPHGRLRCNISSMIRIRLQRRALKKNHKATFDYLPYTVDELKIHLERLFTPGMDWGNYGKWHIDHKIADCKFDYKSMTDEEFQKCWALNNLQPLWAEENLRKNKY